MGHLREADASGNPSPAAHVEGAGHGEKKAKPEPAPACGRGVDSPQYVCFHHTAVVTGVISREITRLPQIHIQRQRQFPQHLSPGNQGNGVVSEY